MRSRDPWKGAALPGALYTRSRRSRSTSSAVCCGVGSTHSGMGWGGSASVSEPLACCTSVHTELVTSYWPRCRRSPSRSLATADTPLLDDASRSEEHTSELQSRENLVCRLLLEKK